MLNHFKLLQCDFPVLFIEIFTLKSKVTEPTDSEIKYLLLIKNMLKHEICEKDSYTNIKFSSDFEALFPKWMNILKKNKIERDKLLHSKSSDEDICNDHNLINYISANEIYLHSCSNIKELMFATNECLMFQINVPPAYEELQINNRIKSFVGTANPIDIIHHVYNGAMHHIFNDEKKYKVLFAEYFTNEMIYGLIGNFATLDFKNFELYILSPKDLIEEDIRGHLEYCSMIAKFNKLVSIIFIHQSLDSYFNTRSRSSTFDTYFDYIEYNGGLSMSQSYMNHLSQLGKLLSDRGVIGLTYFPSNIHVETLRSIMQTRNVSAHMPFSYDMTNAVKEYLNLYDMAFLSKDKQILNLLGGDIYNSPFPFMKETDIVMPYQWNTYKQAEVIDILQQTGYSLISWIPSAYSNPYSEIGDYDVKKYQSFG